MSGPGRRRLPVSDDPRVERRRAQNRAAYHRNKQTQQIRRLRNRYGITLEEFNRRLVEQDGKCAICDRGPNGHGSLHVDHDHATGKVRGLLCFSCNYAIGALQDDPELVAKAHEYLLRAAED